MPGVAATRVLERLHGVRPSGSGWLARCPGHEDRVQSLKIDEADDHSVLVHCHAGCPPAAVVGALGLTFGDLFSPDEDTTRSGRPTLIETYDYKALDGVLLYQGCRYLPKAFKQRRPDGTGGWIWNMNGMKPRRVAYRLPELRGHTTVYVTEGEKDANRLWSLGLPATCNVGGAGKWDTAESKSLKKAGVQRAILLPHRDEAGALHAQKVSASVREQGLAYSVIELDGLAEHGDVSDWLDAGHTRGDLEALVAALPYIVRGPEPVQPAQDARAIPLPTVDPGSYNLTDLGNAEAFRDRHGANLRWDRLTEKWLLWGGHSWIGDADSEVRRLAHDHVRQWGVDAQYIAEFEKRRKVIDFALKREGSGTFDSMLKEAKVLMPIYVQNGGWDEDPWLLGVKNGIVDLRTGEVRPSQRADLVTKQTSVEFDPAAQCPRWLQFVDEVFDGDGSLISYIQRAVGYSLTGIITEQCFFMAYGSGANGKSTLLVALDHVFGGYAHTTDIRTFTLGGDSVPYELAQLAGKRLILTSEARTSSRINEQVLKNFTGGEKVEAQHKYGHPFAFRPIGKIWFAVNHAPKVSDESYGFWRRVRMIPFERTFAGSAEDRLLQERLKLEAPGILAWAVRGCLAWQAEGLNPPLRVMSATDAYQQSEDPLNDFYEDRCVLQPGTSVSAMRLYTAYRTFAIEQGMKSHEILTLKAFGQHVGRVLMSEKTSRGKVYLGIGLKASASEGEDMYSGRPATDD